MGRRTSPILPKLPILGLQVASPFKLGQKKSRVYNGKSCAFPAKSVGSFGRRRIWFALRDNRRIRYTRPFEMHGIEQVVESVIAQDIKRFLAEFIGKSKKPDLLATYFFFLEKKHNICPVLFVREKMIYQSKQTILSRVEKEGKLWRKTEIKIQVGTPPVNNKTKKIYICPFTGKAFGDNTHPNPQDAIYDWVSKCKENKERIDGVRVKRFFVSEDPEVIKNYVEKRKEPISKTVFSSGITGKLFNSKQAVIEDFEKNQLKEIAFTEVPRQNRFQIEKHFLEFIEQQLDEAKISSFVEAMNTYEEFSTHVKRWVEESK